MKKALFIMDHYPNTNSTNSLCCEQIINLMLENGYSVTCLTKRGYNLAKKEICNNVNVYRLHKSLLYVWEQWSTQNSGKIMSKIILLINRIILRLKQIMFISIYPCLTPIFILRLYKEALKIKKKEHFNIVISEHYSFESLAAGHLIKRKFKDIIFIPYFLDSLSGGFNAKYLPGKYCIRKKLKWEKLLVINANKIVVMNSSRAHHEKYSKKMDYYNRIIYLDIPLFKKPSIKHVINLPLIEKGRTNIIFSGYLNKFDRDPTYIINLFNMLQRDDINLIFVGNGNCQHIMSKAKETFCGHIIVSDFLPHDQLVDILAQADYFLNLGVSNSNAISGKIFEYMSFGKPIISTYYIDNEACIPYLKKYPLSLLIDQREYNLHMNVKKLSKFLENNAGKTEPYDNIKNIFYDNTPEAFINVIENEIVNKQRTQYDK